jgi:hypothetical protein
MTLGLLERLGLIIPHGERLFAGVRGRGNDPRLLNLAPFDNTIETNSQHLLDQVRERKISFWMIPSVNPIHHAKK